MPWMKHTLYCAPTTIIWTLSINHAVVILPIKLGRMANFFYSLLMFNNGKWTQYNDLKCLPAEKTDDNAP